MNFLPLYIQYPAWIKPEIFPNVPALGLLRWYGLMYVFAFGTAFFILRKQFREGALDQKGRLTTEDDVISFIVFGIVCLLIGARIFSTLVYSGEEEYRHKPWLIFWPFDTKTGKFTGLAGMSYHGGFIGGLLGMIIWCIWHKRPVWQWIDAMGVSIPLGYTFGRIGNFLNGELYGRITKAPWGMIFPRAEEVNETFSTSKEWVQQFAADCNLAIEPGQRFINLPRHPSQLYEALFEGVVLFVILWLLRKHKPFDGFLGCIYTIGYGIARFFIEYFRQPDSNLGFRISPTNDVSIYTNNSMANLSTGQVFCLTMIGFGLVLMLVLFFWDKYKKKNPEKFQYHETEKDKAKRLKWEKEEAALKAKAQAKKSKK